MLQELITGIYQLSQSTLRVRFNTIQHRIKKIIHYVFRCKGRKSSPAIRCAKRYPKTAIGMQKSGYQPLKVNIGNAHSSQNPCLASDASEHAQLPNFRESPKRWKLLDLRLLAECSETPGCRTAAQQREVFTTPSSDAFKTDRAPQRLRRAFAIATPIGRGKAPEVDKATVQSNICDSSSWLRGRQIGADVF